MINNIRNNVSFGALKYNSSETKTIINDEFNTTELREAAQDIFKRIDVKSTERGIDVVLEGEDYPADKRAPASRFISAYDIDSYIAMSDNNIQQDSLDSYGNGAEEIGLLTDNSEKMQELKRFGAGILKKLEKMEPSVSNKLEDFKKLFN